MILPESKRLKAPIVSAPSVRVGVFSMCAPNQRMTILAGFWIPNFRDWALAMLLLLAA